MAEAGNGTRIAFIAFIGFGEAAAALVDGWDGAHPAIRAYDVKTDSRATADEMKARYAAHGVTGCGSSAEAVATADLVFSSVTPDQAVTAAQVAAPHLSAGTFWLDLNSCAPGSKRAAAAAIAAGRGRYVDVAVMAPVHPKRNLVPLLLAGRDAQAAALLLEALPMSPRVVPGEVGRASAIKMIRSVLIKGLEAVSAECALAAAKAGVLEEVLPSLAHNYPGVDWDAQIA